MKRNLYKEFLETAHPELLEKAEQYARSKPKPPKKPRRPKIERGSWEYICKLFPKLATFNHTVSDSSGGFNMEKCKAWHIFRPVTVGTRVAEVGIKLIVKMYKYEGNWGSADHREVPLKPSEHLFEFYTTFDRASTSSYQLMTNLPGLVKANASYKNHVDIKTKRKEIYDYLGV